MIKLLNTFSNWLNNLLWNIESKKRKVRIIKLKNE